MAKERERPFWYNKVIKNWELVKRTEKYNINLARHTKIKANVKRTQHEASVSMQVTFDTWIHDCIIKLSDAQVANQEYVKCEKSMNYLKQKYNIYDYEI